MARPSINEDWALSLVGLRMQVEERWWFAFDGTKLCPGQISAINFNPTDEKGEATTAFFELQLDGEQYTYGMRYDAVLRYADETDSNYYRFHLPDGLLMPANEEVVRVPSQRKNAVRPRRINNDDVEEAPLLPPFILPLPLLPLSDDDDDDGDDGNNCNNEDDVEYNVYSMTAKEDWKRISGRMKGRTINPVPFTGEDEEFSIRMTDEELAEVTDCSGDIRYERVFKWMLPFFGSENNVGYFEFLAARMRNYMCYIMRRKGYTPKYYCPADNFTIQASHVARFKGKQK